jgi:hypothetical protein
MSTQPHEIDVSASHQFCLQLDVPARRAMRSQGRLWSCSGVGPHARLQHVNLARFILFPYIAMLESIASRQHLNHFHVTII